MPLLCMVLMVRLHLMRAMSHITQEEVFKRREEALKLKDLELQESLIRFSKFLQVRGAAHTGSTGSSPMQRQLNTHSMPHI